jgi:hypothetical protein
MANPGCEAQVAPISENPAFTAWEDRRTHLPEFPLSSYGGPLNHVPESALVKTNTIDGLEIQWGLATQGGAVYLYFLDRPVDKELTVTQFYASGGIHVAQEPLDAGGYSEDVLSTLESRLLTVELGKHSGILTWADPLKDGTRTHNLYWSDGEFTYSIIGDRSPVDIVNLGRSIVCESGRG